MALELVKSLGLFSHGIAIVYGEDAAPSFAMRALHSVLAVARLIYTTHGRILRVVMHRDPNYEKKQAEVPSITL